MTDWLTINVCTKWTVNYDTVSQAESTDSSELGIVSKKFYHKVVKMFSPLGAVLTSVLMFLRLFWNTFMLCCVFIRTAIKFMEKSRRKSVQKTSWFLWLISIIKTKHTKNQMIPQWQKWKLIYMLKIWLYDETISMKRTKALNWRQTGLGHKHSRTNKTQSGSLQLINNRAVWNRKKICISFFLMMYNVYYYFF